MAEQIPISPNNNQIDNQQNLVVENTENQENQQNTENPEAQNPKVSKNLICCLSCLGCIYASEILWNVFAWFVSSLDSIFSFNYKTNKRDVADKYYNGVKIFILPLLALSYINLSVIANRRLHPKITIIIDIILLGIKIPIFILFCKNLFKVCHKETFIPIMSIVLECSLVFVIIIYEMLRYVYIFKNK